MGRKQGRKLSHEGTHHLHSATAGHNHRFHALVLVSPTEESEASLGIVHVSSKSIQLFSRAKVAHRLTERPKKRQS